MIRTNSGDLFKQKNPEAFEKYARAMFLSKGKTDNSFSETLSLIPNSTPEDIVRLQKPDQPQNVSVIWCNKEHNRDYRGENLKKRQAREKFMYSFEDTFYYRYMKKLGILEELVDHSGCVSDDDIVEKSFLVDATHSNGEFDNYNRSKNVGFLKKSESYRIKSLFNEFDEFMSMERKERELICKDKFVLKLWSSSDKRAATLPWYTGEYTSWTKEQMDIGNKKYKGEQQKHKILELIAIHNCPQTVKDKITEYEDRLKKEYEENKNKGYYWRGKESYKFVPFSETWYNNTRLEPWKDEKRLELEDFYKSLNYMGIGIICLGEAHYGRTRNLRKFVSHVNSIVRRFNSDIKHGFDVENVRGMVVDDLNTWLSSRVQDKWTVFARKDAPKSYPNLNVKSKKVVEDEDELVEAIMKTIVKEEKEENKEED